MRLTERKHEIDQLRRKFLALQDCLTERGRRLWAASEALSYGYGGITLVAEATGISDRTIRNGLQNIACDANERQKGVRRPGGGRKKKSEIVPDLLQVLDKLVDPTAKGDPEIPLKWTSKSLRHLANELRRQGHPISFRTTGTLLKELGYSLQANKKTLEKASHVDRNGQFEFINASVEYALHRQQPAISVDAKKKEIIGDFKNNGREYSQKGNPLKVNTHDFPDKRLGKVAPYGIYDIGLNKGWVSIGIGSDTAQFAVNTIRTWWYKMGSATYNHDKVNELLITADCGGSNGYRVKLWKRELQLLSNETGLKIHVRHFPPGTSKWNKIEHKMFSYISKNWRGRPLISKEVVVSLIGATKTSSGLEIMATLDENNYEAGIEISDEEIQSLNIVGDPFHPEWNYTVLPQVR